MRGEANPSKRPTVRVKLSESKRGDLNPARLHREKFAQHIAKYRPYKTSKLETLVAEALPGLKPQHEVGWYRVDLADPVEKIAVEVQGCWFHCCQTCFPGSPSSKPQRLAVGNDRRKHPFLRKQGWQIIEIWEHTIRSLNSEELRTHCLRLLGDARSRR